jgi:hypothetical protein
MSACRPNRACGIGALVLATVAAPAPPPGEAEIEAVRSGSAEASAEVALTEAMNPFVLTNLVSSHLVVEIDRVAGFEPSPAALGAAENLLRTHREEGKQVDVLLGDEIPRSEWEAAVGRSGLEELVARYLDRDPADWGRTEIVYVLYVPDGLTWYGAAVSGMTDRVTFSRDGAVATVQTVLLFTDEIRRDAFMWITPAKIERAILVHELGHVIGLVANPAHAQPGQPRHCNVARCVMHRRGKRAGFVNALSALFAGRIPNRYGKRCLEDIATAKRLWRERAATSPGFVRRLKAERLLRETAIAEDWRNRRSSR